MNPLPVHHPESPSGLGSYIAGRALAAVGAEPPLRFSRRHILTLAGLPFAPAAWASHPDAADRFPALAVPMLHGSAASGHLLAAVQQAQAPGRPVLVYVWATWCPVCESIRVPMLELAKFHALVTVAVKSGSASDVARVAQAKSITWPILVDESGQLGRGLGFNAVPAFMVVSAKLTVDWIHQGLMDPERLRQRLDTVSLSR